MGKVLAVAGMVIGSLVFIFVLLWMSNVRAEVRLRNSISAQQDTNQASFDTMWKILQEQAGVTNEYKDAFKSIYPELIKGRYDDRGSLLAKFVKESNPKFDTGLYKKLMTSIEGERKSFLREQKKLRDLKREHDNLLDSPPSSWFLAGKSHIDVVLVTSDRADAAFESGKDNETLFPPKK